jgi:hypothetical protein
VAPAQGATVFAFPASLLAFSDAVVILAVEGPARRPDRTGGIGSAAAGHSGMPPRAGKSANPSSCPRQAAHRPARRGTPPAAADERRNAGGHARQDAETTIAHNDRHTDAPPGTLAW